MDSENMKSVDLTEDIIEEILARLPVKSLLRFRCVSKSWLSLISSERFIKTQLQSSTKNKGFSHHRVIMKGKRGKLNDCSLHQLLHEPSSFQPSHFYDPTNNLRPALVVGCCDGLVCLFNQRNDLFSLWNPATRISRELPKLDYKGPMNLGFGWDGKSGSYKVIVHDINWKVRVYSSKKNSWKTIVEHRCLYMYDRVGVFACGKIHWIIKISGNFYIESFDLESEEFGRIELPFDPPHSCSRPRYVLAAIEGSCLHLLCFHEQQSYVVVWVMKESSWLKLFITRPRLYNLRDLPKRPLFGGGPDGEILMRLGYDFLVYYPKDDVHVIREGMNIPRFPQGYVYVESLVSPDFTTSTSLM